MEQIKTLTDYDKNAISYDNFRTPSPLIIKILQNTFSDNQKILSLGCGTGQYGKEFRQGKNIVGFDLSQGMLRIAKKRIQDTLSGNMVNLPFLEDSFQGIYFVHSLHHVGANLKISTNTRNEIRKKTLSEANRVLKQGHIVLVQRDPSQNQCVWFWKYFPKALETKLIIQPKITTIASWLKELGLSEISTTPIFDPMIKEFFEPEAPLDPDFRKSFSDFSYLSNEEMNCGVEKLKKAISSGDVQKDIENCRRNFEKIGGTVFVITAKK